MLDSQTIGVLHSLYDWTCVQNVGTTMPDLLKLTCHYKENIYEKVPFPIQQTMNIHVSFRTSLILLFYFSDSNKISLCYFTLMFSMKFQFIQRFPKVFKNNNPKLQTAFFFWKWQIRCNIFIELTANNTRSSPSNCRAKKTQVTHSCFPYRSPFSNKSDSTLWHFHFTLPSITIFLMIFLSRLILRFPN